MGDQSQIPVVALSLGDVAGIGPEILVRALCGGSAHAFCRPLIVGDPDVVAENARILRANLRVHAIAQVGEARFAPVEVDVLPVEGARFAEIPWGQPSAATGRAAALCLERCFALASAGQVHGVVSAPLNKEAFHNAGYDYLDELAFIADLTASSETFTAGVVDRLWTLALAEHVPFADILAMVTHERVRLCIDRLDSLLRRVGHTGPRIAVAALNVHGGEGGLFGREEIDQIEPAVREARQAGVNVTGPIPADTVFVRALAGEFDAVVGMYHDQANIARKLQPKSTGATMFQGLPVACGTTAHGTACDIAGKGVADPGSLAAALRYTAMLASRSLRPDDRSSFQAGVEAPGLTMTDPIAGLEAADGPVSFAPIGYVEGIFDAQAMPEDIAATESRIVLNADLVEGLTGVAAGERVMVVFHCNRAEGYELLQHPRGDITRTRRGVFALHTPFRPNPIGVTIVDVLAVEGNVLRVRGLDALHGTPVLDLKLM